jgi:hypothetical protein
MILMLIPVQFVDIIHHEIERAFLQQKQKFRPANDFLAKPGFFAASSEKRCRTEQNYRRTNNVFYLHLPSSYLFGSIEST